MGKTTLSCGHEEISHSLHSSYNITIKSHDREGNKAIDYVTVCELCKKDYEKNKNILYTEEDQNIWLERYVSRTVEELYAPIDQDLIAAFLYGHDESMPKDGVFNLAELNNSYEDWMKLKNEYENDEHCGDCTKQPMTCMRCTVDEYKERADLFIKQIFRSYDLDEDMMKNILYKAYNEIKYGWKI